MPAAMVSFLYLSLVFSLVDQSHQVPRPWDFSPRPKASPGPPASPEAPKPSAGNNDKSTEGTGAPAQPAPSEGSNPSEAPYPVAPSMPMMPQLFVTPATLPRSTPVPQEEAAT
jgi:hypothetical protein